MANSSQVFICAAPRDADSARALEGHLRELSGKLDSGASGGLKVVSRTDSGQESGNGKLSRGLSDTIRDSRVLAVICSPEAERSKWTQAALDAFSKAHPAGIVIPVVIEGEPNPEESKEALAKPCFPKTLKGKHRGKWIDARKREGIKSAAVLVLAAVRGESLEELCFRLAERRSGSPLLPVAAGLVLAVIGAAFFIGSRTDFGSPEPVPVTSANPPGSDTFASVEDAGPVVESEPLDGWQPRWDEALEILPLLEVGVVNLADPGEAFPALDDKTWTITLNSWIDNAAHVLGRDPGKANRWAEASLDFLRQADGSKFLPERYRLHTLLSTKARRIDDQEGARDQMRLAVEAFLGLPDDELVKSLEEAFAILDWTSREPGMRESSEKLVDWMLDFRGSALEVLLRGEALIALATDHDFAREDVEKWLENAEERIEPEPEDPILTEVAVLFLQARLAAYLDDQKRLEELIAAGKSRLEKSSRNESLRKATLAQFDILELGQKEDEIEDEEMAGRLEELIPLLQKGTEDEDWARWYAPSVALALEKRADLHLAANEYQKAAIAYRQAFRNAVTEPWLVRILLKAGCVHRYESQHALALETFERALELVGESGPTNEHITALHGAALAAAKLGDSLRARGLVELAGELMARRDAYYPPKYWREPLSEVYALKAGR